MNLPTMNVTCKNTEIAYIQEVKEKCTNENKIFRRGAHR
jgi:hypothetical protein